MRFVLILAVLSALVPLAGVAAPAAPSNVTVTRLNVNSVQVKWKDNSTNEVRFDIWAFQGGAGPFFITSAPSNNVLGATNSFNCAGLVPPGFGYQFFVRSFISATGNNFSDSPLSTNLVMPPFPPPSNFTAVVTNSTNVRFTWKADGTTNETLFFVGYRPQGSTNSYEVAPNGVVSSNVTNVTISMPAGTAYQFAMFSYYEDTVSNCFSFGSTPVSVATSNVWLAGLTFHPAVVGSAITPYATIAASSNSGAPTNYSITGTLPPGLSFSSATRQVTGTPTTAGVYTPTLVAQYGGSVATISTTLTFRVIHPNAAPILTAALTNRVFTNTSPATNIALTPCFLDRDTERAVRVVTTKGTVDLALYPTATPQTVSNFLGYVTRGDYNNAIFHRASQTGFEDFVVQGGGFKPNPATGGTNLTAIPTTPSPTNEPGVRHVRGTLAMAKVGNNPNSATDQWFVNLRDNSDILDSQNGGFTAFGRVCGVGMSVFDAIMQLPRATYTVNIDGGDGSFDDWPLDLAVAPPEIDYNALVLMTSVAPIEPLSYSITQNTLPAVVSAAVVGTNLVLTPLNSFGGTSTITVAATDLDGNSVAQTFLVTVNTPYTAWVAQFGLSGNGASSADPEGDGIVNGAEFVLMGNPNSSDALSVRPTNSFTNISAQSYFTQTFRLRKNLSGASAILRGSSAIPGNWTNLWTSGDVGSPLVLQQTDLGDHWLLRVRDALPVPATNGARFLNLQVQTPQ